MCGSFAPQMYKCNKVIDQKGIEQGHTCNRNQYVKHGDLGGFLPTKIH